ncbi:outer membrane beta-barrel protein [Fibrobacterota bacterium]
MIHQFNLWIISVFTMTGLCYSAEVNLGLKGGGSLQHMWGIDAGFSQVIVGGCGGIFTRVKFMEMFGAQFEVLYTMKGGKTSEALSPDTLLTGMIAQRSFSRRTMLTYVEVPLIFKIYAPGYPNSNPHILIGPYYGYLMSRDKEDKCTQTQGSNVGACDNRTPEMDEPMGPANDNDYGLTLGGGFDFGLGTFDLRYTIGFKTVEKSSDDDSRTGTLSVMMGFLLY